MNRARELRNNPSDAERQLWMRLRYRQVDGAKFRRQAPIGPYIVDFVCFEKKLIVEVDGGQHGDRREADEARTLGLARQGFRIVRFWNHEVLAETDAVLMVIQQALNESAPHPSLPHEGGGITKS
jgi:adenine-specific DNA-methyltransferase